MKNRRFILAIAIIAAAACAKEIEVEEQEPQSLPGMASVTVKATLEEDGTSKTEMNTYNGYVSWTAGDKIKAVYNGGNAVSDPLGAAGNAATFHLVYPEGETLSYVVYPSDIDASYDGGQFKVVIPDVQNGSFADAAISVAPYGESISMKNLGGLLQIVIDDDAVRSIRISSNNNTPIVGTATVTFSGGLPVIGALSGTSTSISIAVSGAGTYYASVLPCSLEAGIYAELFDENNQVIGEKFTGNTLTVARHQMLRLGLIGASTMNKYFFKPGGLGDGRSWDTAGGITLMDQVLSGDSDAMLFLAHGAYEIENIDGIDSRAVTSQCIRVSNHVFKVYGGYPDTNGGTSLSGRDLSQETVISGGSRYRLLVFNSAKTQFTADGIKFTGAYRTGPDIGSALILNNQKSAVFHKCTISENGKEGSGGGIVRIATGGNISFKECVFTANTASADGGVMGISAGNVTMDNCTFSQNSTLGNGGVLSVSGGTVDFTDCEFFNNAVSGSGKKGSVIYATGESVMRMDRCYIHENSSMAGGAIKLDSSNAILMLNACSFYKNATTTYASAIETGGICGINNCAFQQNNNTSATGAANIYVDGGTTIVANTSMRMSGVSAVALWAAGGTTYIANNTMVNSNTSQTAADKCVALKTSANLITYGHNLVSKSYVETGGTYSLENATDADILDYSIAQSWHSSKHCIYWSSWGGDGAPAGWTFASPLRVEQALDAFETASPAGFKFWLQRLHRNGYNALQTDILGYIRGSVAIWPGSYEKKEYNLAPQEESGTLQKVTKSGTLIRASAADPCIVYSHGEFFLTMTGATRLAMIQDSDLSRLKASNHPISAGSNNNICYDSTIDPNIAAMFGEGTEISGTWSPEIHYFSEDDCPGNSGWYLIFAVRKSNTKILPVVLKASGTTKPTGPWRHPLTGEINCTQRFLDAAGNPFTQWAIGVSYLRVPTGKYKGIYALWVDETGRGQGYGNFYQRIRIARLSKPWQIASEAGIVTYPTQNWEKKGADDTYPMVVEGGTAVYGEHGEIYLTYCGSGYWSDYGQGQLTLKRENGDYADPLQTSSWIKYEGNPVFSSNPSDDLRGAGHVFFFKDDAGNGFVCYHAYPYVNGERQSSRNAYVEPYYIDYNQITPSSPEGVIHFGVLDNGSTAPVSGTSFDYWQLR